MALYLLAKMKTKYQILRVIIRISASETEKQNFFNPTIRGEGF